MRLGRKSVGSAQPFTNVRLIQPNKSEDGDDLGCGSDALGAMDFLMMAEADLPMAHQG